MPLASSFSAAGAPEVPRWSAYLRWNLRRPQSRRVSDGLDPGAGAVAIRALTLVSALMAREHHIFRSVVGTRSPVVGLIVRVPSTDYRVPTTNLAFDGAALLLLEVWRRALQTLDVETSSV